MNILTCMHDCNFADEVCVWVMSTLLWTCPQNRGQMDGLIVGSISCYFMLQNPNLGVCKCILCPCVMFLHTSCMYLRLQPVFSINLCSVGFANVDVFWASVFYKKSHKLRVFAAMNIKNRCRLKPATSSFYCNFSLQLGTWIKSYDVLSETPHIL